MASLQEKIAGLFPAATFEEVDGTLTVSIADEQWHDLARTLKKDPEISRDYLVTIIDNYTEFSVAGNNFVEVEC